MSRKPTRDPNKPSALDTIAAGMKRRVLDIPSHAPTAISVHLFAHGARVSLRLRRRRERPLWVLVIGRIDTIPGDTEMITFRKSFHVPTDASANKTIEAIPFGGPLCNAYVIEWPADPADVTPIV